MEKSSIVVTSLDLERLRALIADCRRDQTENPESLKLLERELDRAQVVSPLDVPPDVVTMNSTVRVTSTENRRGMTWTIVYPHEADFDENRMSVLAPIGTALLGYRAGDVVEWEVPAGRRQFRITKVLHQPEAAGQLEH